MLKKTVIYEDFNEREVTEDHYFHLSKADLIVLEMSQDGGLEKRLNKIIADQNGAEIVKELKRLILLAYGKRSEDGSKFHKSQELRDEFEASEAFSTLFFELCTDEIAAIGFVNGIIPSGLRNDAEKIIGKPEVAPQKPEPEAESPPTEVMPIRTTLTRKEVVEMDASELTALLAQGAVITD